MLIKSHSAFDYQQTRERLLKAISDNGLVLFGEFDHAKAAHNVGLTMPPTTVLVF
ncbi:Putative inner membrane or exported, partial [Salmonella enterica subsp. enterica serovar Urbana str. R8-2977]